MPIYEFYSPETNRIYSFFAKTLAQAKLVPKCPDDPKASMVKLLSSFAVGGKKGGVKPEAPGPGGPDEVRMDVAMGAMEREFSSVDENDPRAMARMMRRMAELSGERLDGPMEEAVRKLEEGADPDSLEEAMGDAFAPEGEEEKPGPGATESGAAEPRARFRVRRPPPVRDPKLYDYE
jgi:hypothetical protein